MTFPALLALAVSCSVYDEALLPSDRDNGSGGASSGGGIGGGIDGIGGDGSGATPGNGGSGNDSGDGGSDGDGGAEGDGGSGGTSGSGGSGASTGGGGGSDIQLTLVADMEGGTNEISLPSGDYWFTTGAVETCISPNLVDDLAVASTELPEPRPLSLEPDGGESSYAMHFVGAACETWGSQAGFGLKAGGSYDASAFDGVAFWARLGSTDANRALRVELADVSTHPDGGECTPPEDDPEPEEECFAHYFRTRQLDADPSVWTFFKIPFADFTQPGFGYDGGPLDTDQLYQIMFKWPIPPIANTDFDVWIDDIYFYKDL